jgi:hypothetical protein
VNLGSRNPLFFPLGVCNSQLNSFVYIFNYSLLDSELSSYLTLHPPIAKRALYCLVALHSDKKDKLLQEMIDVKEKKSFK